MLKVIGYFLLVELIQILVVVVLFKLVWRYLLKDRLPKAWVDNLTMMGVTP